MKQLCKKCFETKDLELGYNICCDCISEEWYCKVGPGFLIDSGLQEQKSE